METRDEAIQKTVTRLQAIKTLDDYKEAKDEVLELMEGVFKATIFMVGDVFENVFSLKPEEKQVKIEEFQDDDFPFGPEIGKELGRLDSIPGGIEYSESFIPELENRMAPYMAELAEKLGKVMEALMGGLVEGMAQAFNSGVEEEAEEESYYDPNNPDTPQMLYTLYIARTLDDLVTFKSSILQYLEDEMKYNISELDTLTDTDFGGITADVLPRIKDWRHNFNRFTPEFDKEFERLAALPDAADTVLKIKKDILDKLAPTMSTLKELLDKANEQEKALT